MSAHTTGHYLQAGREAAKRGAWEEARRNFERALETDASAEAFEELGWVASWTEDAAVALSAREKALALYQEEGNRTAAARVAIWLAVDYMEFRGERAVADGLLQRAHRLLEGHEGSLEYAWVQLIDGHIALMEEKDTIAAAAHGQTAVRIGRALNDVDTTMMGEALRGLALVTEGKVAEGMRLLDHATTTATTGEATYLPAIGTTCCYLIHACQRVFDYDRAAQWCHRVKEFCRQWQSGSLFAICRTQYAMVLIARGRWGEAERELLSASSELSRYRPALVNACTVRLGELRRRQGRWEEALQLFEQVQSHILSFLGRGWIALDQDDAKTALEFAERYLRRVPAGDRTERVPGLELLFRSLLKLGKMELAETTASELQVTADLIPAKPLRAAASLARGLVSSARSELDNALREIEDGIDLFEDIAMPYDAALARKELALLFLRLDRITRAEMEAKKALQVFEQLGAAKEAERVAEIVRQIQHHGDSVPPATPARNEEGLTRREIEVLRRVAAGKRNAEIADELFVSIRTVEAHVTSIYRKLGVSGIRARAAIIQYARTQGISPST